MIQMILKREYQKVKIVWRIRKKGKSYNWKQRSHYEHEKKDFN